MRRIFVTGIGTDVGKTVVAAVLTEALGADYWKPVQAGDLGNTDTMKVKQWVRNPATIIHEETFRLTEPMSPHAAANIDNISITVADCAPPETVNTLIIEGAGGLLVPINDSETMLDLALALDTEIIVVIRNYLGSINHSLLTIARLREAKANVLGIIYSGTAVDTSEEAVATHGGLNVLGRVDEATDLNAEFIAEQATKFKNV